MSLRKKQTMTQAKTAANKANGKFSKGPATPEGRKRIREANTRHGFYSEAEAMALACLGEDPADLERLRANLHGDFEAPSALEKELAEHLVQVVWRWKRAGRGQEGHALRRAKDANLTREDRLHAQMMRLKITAETLRRLAQAVAQENYFTRREDLEMMKNLHQEGAVKEVGEIALALFYQLQKPGTGEDGMDPDEMSRRLPSGQREASKMLALHSKAGKMLAAHSKADRKPALPKRRKRSRPPFRRKRRRASERASFWRISSDARGNCARRSVRPY